MADFERVIDDIIGRDIALDAGDGDHIEILFRQ